LGGTVRDLKTNESLKQNATTDITPKNAALQVINVVNETLEDLPFDDSRESTANIPGAGVGDLGGSGAGVGVGVGGSRLDPCNVDVLFYSVNGVKQVGRNA
jgi:hypothetical protein